MSSYPSAEQIKIWEDMEFHRERQSYQAYVNNGIPTSLEHKQWLENQGKRRKNGQQELLGGGSPERAFQTAERTETIPPGRGTSQVPLEAAHGSPQPQHKRLPDRGRRGPMRSFAHEELVSPISLLTLMLSALFILKADVLTSVNLISPDKTSDT